MTICPCCGSKFDGDLSEGCPGCGARAVGPPLARPDHELPSYGHALAAAASGVLLALTFIVATVAALFRRENFSLEPWAILIAAEAAAWRVKWFALPASLIAAWAGARLCARVRREPARFAGLGAARAGLALTVLTGVALAVLVAARVPARLRQREVARRAAENALLYATDQALTAYRARFKSYPRSLSDLRRLDDPDCSLARVLAAVEAGDYKPEADLASLSGPRRRRGGAPRRAVRVRSVSELATDDLSGPGLSLTNYDLVLPGRDKILGTEDDLRLRDGVILGPAPAGQRRTRAGAGAGAH